MTSGQAKQKGNVYERHICHKLSLWVSNFTREDIFWRSAMSGGRAKLASRKDGHRKLHSQAGDISAIHPMGSPLLDLFVIECKFYKKISLQQWCYGHNGVLYHEWLKLLDDCKIGDHPRLPFMAVRENRRQDLILTTDAGVKALAAGSKVQLSVLFIFPASGIHGLLLRDVLAEVDPSVMVARNLASTFRPRPRIIIPDEPCPPTSTLPISTSRPRLRINTVG